MFILKGGWRGWRGPQIPPQFLLENTRTLSASKFLFAGTILANKFLFAGTLPANLFLFAVK